MKEWSDLLTAFASVIQAGAWPIVCFTLMLLFKEDLKKGCLGVYSLFPRLNNAEFGKLKFNLSPPENILALPDVKQLPSRDSNIANQPSILTAAGRASIYNQNRGLFLTHVFEPITDDGHYTVQIYLIGHQKFERPHDPNPSSNNSLRAVERADFFLGSMWNNQIFTKTATGNQTIGITVAAYGPFLCTCVVTFKDGETIELYRYVDFEMHWAFPTQSEQ